MSTRIANDCIFVPDDVLAHFCSRPYLALFEVSSNKQGRRRDQTAIDAWVYFLHGQTFSHPLRPDVLQPLSSLPSFCPSTSLNFFFLAPSLPFYLLPSRSFLQQQILCKHARDIAAETASGNQEWKEAAENLRLPYWDWAIKKMPPPEVMTMTSIDVVKPDGTTMTIDQNPLFAYNFKDQSSISTVGRNRTRRGNPIWLDDNGTTELRIKVSQMFDTIHDWFGFSNDARFEETTASHANSLEAIHDQIHGDVGGFMGSIPTAGEERLGELLDPDAAL